MNKKEKINFFKQLSKDRERELDKISKKIWEFAEPGYEEHESMKLMTSFLEEEGFSVSKNIDEMETAFIATFGQREPVIGILAEYDALPDLSQIAGLNKECSREGEGFGHGCGHNLLGTGSLGGAIFLKEYLEKTNKPGTVKLFGCPAEETGAGKTFMVDKGAFDGVDVGFSWHPEFYNAVFAAKSNAYYQVKFEFEGISSHAAIAPEEGRSALDACELMNLGSNYLREHVPSDVRFHYAYLDSGGKAPNIIPRHGSLLYYIRAPKISECEKILDRIIKIAEGAALMTETKMTYEIIGGLSDLVPNIELAKVLSEAFVSVGGPEFGEDEYRIAREFFANYREEKQTEILKKYNLKDDFIEKPLLKNIFELNEQNPIVFVPGSTDVGDVSYKLPMAQFFVASGIPGTSLHSWEATAQVGTSIGTKALLCAAETMALAGSEIIDKPDIGIRAKEELLERTNGNYISPIKDVINPPYKK